ncbi:MAG: hypothetical protein LOY58_05760 [Gammaproteobacteria bacterium]|nr:hypothetical protein [Gammaproteobacteria bacterium]
MSGPKREAAPTGRESERAGQRKKPFVRTAFEVGRGERVRAVVFAKHCFARPERPEAVPTGRESERTGQRKKPFVRTAFEVGRGDRTTKKAVRQNGF